MRLATGARKDQESCLNAGLPGRPQVCCREELGPANLAAGGL